jgi:hypothetical protein
MGISKGTVTEQDGVDLPVNFPNLDHTLHGFYRGLKPWLLVGSLPLTDSGDAKSDKRKSRPSLSLAHMALLEPLVISLRDNPSA